MTDCERYNRINIYHCLGDDMVVMLPHLAYRNSTIGFGNGAVVAREDVTTIGAEILRMLDHCVTADTTPLEEKHDAAMDRLRRGIELSHEEYFPSFDDHVPDNWGRIYEQYPALLHNYRVLTRYFSTAEISDAKDSDSLTLSQLQVIRRGKDRGIYRTADVTAVERTAGVVAIGGLVSERLDSWRPSRSFFGRLTAQSVFQ